MYTTPGFLGEKMNEWRRRAKDRSPYDTVKLIKNILDTRGFTYEYKERKSDVAGITSSVLSVQYNGVVTRSNGKGSSPEFTEASAFAEMIERLQNMCFYPQPYGYDKHYQRERYRYNPYPPTDYETEMAEGKLLYMYAESIAKSSSLYELMPEKVMEATKLRFKELFFDSFDNKVPVELFYNYKTGDKAFIPWCALIKFFSSNGMASGNTLEEAIVQAMCEIFERHSQMEMFEGKAVFPDIPREIAFESDYIRNIVTDIESRGYKVYMKDASMGRNYPVVATFIVNPASAKATFRFGSHPSMEVALERTFTETLQGRDTIAGAGWNDVVFSRKDDWRSNADFNAIKIGNSIIQASYIIGKPTYEFERWERADKLDNKEMAEYLLDLLVNEGYTPYITDNSWMGFPSVAIFVPFFSETKKVTSVKLTDIKERKNLCEAIRKPDELTKEDAEDRAKYAISFRNASLEGNFGTMLYFDAENPTGARDFPGYVAALLSVYAENYEKAYIFMDAAYKSDPDDSRIKAFATYLNGRSEGYGFEDSMKVIELLYEPAIAEETRELFSEPDQILKKTFFDCRGDCENCNITQCRNGKLNKFLSDLTKWKYEAGLDNKNLEKIFKDNV